MGIAELASTVFAPKRATGQKYSKPDAPPQGLAFRKQLREDALRYGASKQEADETVRRIEEAFNS